MLSQTIKQPNRQVAKHQSFQKTTVDSTVHEKAIPIRPTANCWKRARQHLVKQAADAGLMLCQNYNREAPRLDVQVGRYGHAKQYKRMHGMAEETQDRNQPYLA
jgi:IS5 family transposase